MRICMEPYGQNDSNMMKYGCFKAIALYFSEVSNRVGRNRERERQRGKTKIEYAVCNAQYLNRRRKVFCIPVLNQHTGTVLDEIKCNKMENSHFTEY